MTSPRNNEIQKAFISKLKLDTSLSTELVLCESSVVEIREDQWQGDQFVYPNVRVRMINNNPQGDTAYCSRCNFEISLMVFDQGYSSSEADKLAGIISISLNDKTFFINDLEVYVYTVNLIPAVRSDMHTWRAECLMRGTASRQTVVPVTPVVPVFSPADISDMVLWYDINALVGLNDGDAIATMADQSGNGWTATQGTAGARPTYKTGIANGKPVARFDGGDWLATAGAVTHGVGAGDCSVIAVAYSSTVTGIYHTLWMLGNYAYGIYNNAGVWQFYAAGGGFNFATPLVINTWYIFEFNYNIDTVKAYINGVVDANTSVVANNMPNAVFTVGYDNYGADTWTGDIAELIFYKKSLSVTERPDLVTYLKTKYGIA